MPGLNDMTAPFKEAKSFDAWFFAQSKKAQARMREGGVVPYREMVQSRHIYEVHENHDIWAHTEESSRTEVDTFIARDHVGVMLKAFIDALAHSNTHSFRRHVELVRWSLSLPGCLDSRLIAKMYGRSHVWAQTRARQIRAAVNSDACGMFPSVHANSRRLARKR